MNTRNKSGRGRPRGRRSNSSNLYNQQQFSQIQSQQNNNPASNHQLINFTSISQTSSSISQNQTQEILQNQNPELFQSQSQNQQQVKIPKKRGRKPKPKPTDQNIAVNGVGLSQSLMNTRTRSSSQNQANEGGNASEDDENEYDPRDNEDNEGMPIDAILCKTQFPFQPSIQIVPASPSRNANLNLNANTNLNSSQSSSNVPNISRSSSVQNFDPNESQFLVELPGQAPIHSFIVCEHSIKNGSQSGKLFNEFKKSCEYNKVKISSAGIEFLEPFSMEKLVDIDSFEIEQIIAHRTFESETKFMEKLMDDNTHIPGLPTEFFPPNFEEIFKYSNSFSPSQNEAYLMLREDGFFSIGENQGNCNQILTKDLFREVEHEEDQITEKNKNANIDENASNNDSSNNNDSNEDSNLKIPDKIEFKIQWKDLPASESTWESYESLIKSINFNNAFEPDDNRSNINNNVYNKYLNNGTIIKQNLFCPTNMDELENMIHTYWSRVVVLSEKNVSSSSLVQKDEMIPIEAVPENIPQMFRQTTLTDVQQNIIKQLFQYKINFVNNRSYDNLSNGLCQIIQQKDSGRVFAIVGFLQMLYMIYHFTKPSMIIVHDDFADVWKDALKSISTLFWVDFTGSSPDRMMIKHHRLDLKTRFDVLITNSHVLEREADFLQAFQWDNIIIDDVHLSEEYLNSQFFEFKANDINAPPKKKRGRKPKNFNQRVSIENLKSDELSSNEKEIEDENENNGNNKEDVNSKNENNVLLDLSISNRSRSLAVLASTLLKNRKLNNNGSQRKNSSPFIIVMNDIFAYSPIFNQMQLSGEIVPFHFTETIYLVPNLISQYMSKKLSILFRKRAARVLNMGKAVDILHEIVLSLQHPFVVPEIHNELYKEFMSMRNLNPQKMNPSIELEFLRSICGKLSTLDELAIGTRERSLSITVVVAEDLAILKLLRLYFVSRRIPAGIVNTNIAIERVPDDFAYGILLMNREITHPLVDKFTISQIIFYDVSTCYKKDLDFIQFITRQQNNQQINVYRLLTRHSIETELFIRTVIQPKTENTDNNFSQTYPSFDYRDLSIRKAEPWIRAAVLSVKESEKEREDGISSTPQYQYQYPVQQAQMNRQVQNVTSFAYEFPTGNASLPSNLSSVMDQVDRDEFWAFVFQTQTVVKADLTDFSNYVYNFEENENENQNENENEDNNQAENKVELLPEYQLYIELLKKGMNNWELISATINKPQEEVQKIGKAMILKMLSSIHPNDIFNFTLASNIYWFEYSGTFANGHQLDEPEFWSRIAESNSSQINSPLFQSVCFLVPSPPGSNDVQTVFEGQSAERNLKYFEQNYVIRAFLSIHQPPYIPTRLLSKKGSVMYTPMYIYSFLNFYSQNTGDWEKIKAKFRLNSYSTESVIGYFKELYEAILTDLFSFVLHRVYSGERELLVQRHQMLWPLLQVLEQGPFTLNWTEQEVNIIINVLLNYRIPLAGQSIEDWCEFHSLTRMLTKSTESVEFLTSYLVEGVMGLQDNQKFAIIPDISLGEPINLVPSVVKKLRLQMSTLQYIQQLSREEKLKEFNPQVSLPENWTVEDDQSIVRGICQFGFGRILDLGKVDISLYNSEENGKFCAIMNKDLTEFSSFVEDKASIMMRLKLIVTSNVDISQNYSNLIKEQFTTNIAVSHRRGRPPNPNKHKDTSSTISSSTSFSSKPKASISKTSTATTTAATTAPETDTEAPPIEPSNPLVEEAPVVVVPPKKEKKNNNSSSKQKRNDDENGFLLENEGGNEDDDYDEEYGENDSDENDFSRRLRTRPMETRARSSLMTRSGAMKTRNQSMKEKQKSVEKDENEYGNEEEEEEEQKGENMIIENEELNSQASSESANKKKTQKNEQKPKKIIKVEEEEPKEKPIIKPKPKQIRMRVRPRNKKDEEDDDEDGDFHIVDDDDERYMYEGVSNAGRMHTRSSDSVNKNVNQIKTRSQNANQAPSKKRSVEKKFRKISFIFSPIPDSIKFTYE